MIWFRDNNPLCSEDYNAQIMSGVMYGWVLMLILLLRDNFTPLQEQN